MRILQSRARAPHGGRYRLHCFGLADHALADLLLHAQQLFLLAFQHSLDRHAGPARDHLRHVVGCHRLLHHGALAVRGFDAVELFLDLRDAAISQLPRALVLALALGVGQLDAQMIKLRLEPLRLGQLLLLRLPARSQIGGLLLQRRQLLFEISQALLGAGVVLLLERLLLDLQPHDLAIDRIELLRLGIDLHLEPRSRLVDQIDRLVRQEAVADIAVRERGGRDQRRNR